MRLLQNVGLLLLMSFGILIMPACEDENNEPNPKACLQVDMNQAEVGEPITFFDCSDEAARIVIDFGDNSFTRSAPFEHSYHVAGTYEAILKAYSESSEKSSESLQIITIGESTDSSNNNNNNDIIPVACFTASTILSETNVDIQFLNCSLNGFSFEWDFDDGNTSTDQNPQHSYTSSGTYVVNLTVTSSTGNQADTSVNITIGERYLSAIVLKTYNPTKDGTTLWDGDLIFNLGGDEPDVIVTLTSNSGENLSTPVQNDLTLGALPFTWDVASENLKLTNENWTVQLLDDEGFFVPDEEMTSWNTNLGTVNATGTIELINGSFTLELEYQIW